MTPGGYELDPDANWTDLAMVQQFEDHDAVNPSAPTMDDEDSELDSDDPDGAGSAPTKGQNGKSEGLSLTEKLAQRPGWKELEYRGILLDDPEKSAALQQSHRDLKKRKASIQLERTLLNRPDPQQLIQRNILKDLPPEIAGDSTGGVAINGNGVNGNVGSLFAADPFDDAGDGVKVHFGRQVSDQYDVADLDFKLDQRLSPQEMQRRGILLGDPTSAVPVGVQAQERAERKRRASQNVDMMLRNRPDVEQLAAHNIIDRTDTNTAALFFSGDGGDGPPRHQNGKGLMTMTMGMGLGRDSGGGGNVQDEYGRTVVDRASIPRRDIVGKMALKLQQRPSIAETVARGILMHRTDTKLNYNLQAAQRQLHRRRASQSLEKLMASRPQPIEMERKGILVSSAAERANVSHRKKRSVSLDSALKRRMSLSEMHGLGFLFMDHGYEFAPESDSEEEDCTFIEDAELRDKQRNIAGLFKQKPRTSKPLQEQIRAISMDFEGVEFSGDFGAERGRRGSVDVEKVERAERAEPSLMTKAERMERVGVRLGQRPSVEEMRMRGLLLDHPAVSQQLLRRKQRLMRRRASNKVATMLQSRPRRLELENKNILLREDESLDVRRRHKRKASATLDSKLQRRPKLMEQSEARRQRQRSLSDHDFRPDYLQHILSNEEDEDIGRQLHDVDIRFLNVGGYVIPLVSPKFMSDLVGIHCSLWFAASYCSSFSMTMRSSSRTLTATR